MDYRRRDLLKVGGAALATGLAGCNDKSGQGTTAGGETTATTTEQQSSAKVTADVAVAAEWNVYRARVFDALALGLAGEASAGVEVAAATMETFENASGTYGAHTKLEKTSHEHYEGFEHGLEGLQTALSAENTSKAKAEAKAADEHLYAAQKALVGADFANALDFQLHGIRVKDAAFLAGAGKTDGGMGAASLAFQSFESAPSHEAVEQADHEAYEAFESAAKAAIEAARTGDAKTAKAKADAALAATIKGSYAIAGNEKAAGSGHIAAMQSQGWDAATLAGMGGPGEEYAHAAVLNLYRHRAYDCHWLAARGETDTAATMAGDILAHFENAEAHEALEHADHDAYEGFEHGVEELQTAIKNGNSKGIDAAVKKVDTNLVTGIEALVRGDARAALEAGFFRARLADARELYEQGQNNTADSLVDDLMERFENDELGLHETMESVSHDLYEKFEETHLKALDDAFAATNDSGVSTHFDGAMSALLTFESKLGATLASGAEAGYIAARAFDAAAVAAQGKYARAETIAADAMEHFEAGAAGYHEALEHANHDLYESFEGAIEGVQTAAANNGDVYAATKTCNTKAIASVYAVVEAAGGTLGGVAASYLDETLATFEDAKAHELLESADEDAYHAFEEKLKALRTAAKQQGDVDAALQAFAKASIRAQFAIVGETGKAPV